jgi:hypothetical protein
MNFGTSWMKRMCIAPILLLTINVSLLTGCLLAKTYSEHDVLWTGTLYGFELKTESRWLSALDEIHKSQS